MRKLLLVSSLILLVSGFVIAQDKAAKLVEVKKVYIGDLGKEEGSELVREKIRIRLMKSDRFVVVESPDAADAILMGVAGVTRSQSGRIWTDSSGDVQGRGGTNFSGIGVLRLVHVKSEETIWVFEYKRGFVLGGSVSSRVADKTVEKLLKDAKAAEMKTGTQK